MDEAHKNMKAAQDAHSAALRWNGATQRLTQTVCDLQLNALHADAIKAEKAYAKACRKGGR